MNLIELSHVTTTKNKLNIINDVSFTVKENDFFCIVGRKESGKTLLLEYIIKCQKFSKGNIYVNGRNIYGKMNYYLKDISYVPKERSLSPKLTIYENLYFFAKLFGLNEDEAANKILEVIDLLGINNRAYDRCEKITTSLARKVSVAIALLSSPKILLLDEPTYEVDLRIRNDFWNLIKKLKGSITIIFTTKSLEEAKKVATRFAIIEHGRLIDVTSTKELLKMTGCKTLEEAYLQITGGEIEDL